MTLTATDLAVRFGSFRAVGPCSFKLAAGRLTALLGPNGAGKTTLLRSLAGIVAATGDVSWDGRSLGTIGRRARARLLAYLPQANETYWPLTVRELVELGRLPHRRFGEALGPTDHAVVEKVMHEAAVDEFADRRIDELSGGERMRAHLARVLAVDAPILLVDEPIANLDPAHQLTVMELLADYAASGRCVVAVMHDVTFAARFSDEVILLKSGKVVGRGEPESILNREMLESVYGVAAVFDRRDNLPLIVPWSRTEKSERAHDKS